MNDMGRLLTIVQVDCIKHPLTCPRNKCYYLVTLTKDDVILLVKKIDGFTSTSSKVVVGCDVPKKTDPESISAYLKSAVFHKALVKALVAIQPTGIYNKASLEMRIRDNARYVSSLEISYIDDKQEICNGTLTDAYASIGEESNVFIISNSMNGFIQLVIKMEGECHIDHRHWKKFYD